MMLNKAQNRPLFIVHLIKIKQPNLMSYEAKTCKPLYFQLDLDTFRKMAEFRENIKGAPFFSILIIILTTFIYTFSSQKVLFAYILSTNSILEVTLEQCR